MPSDEELTLPAEVRLLLACCRWPQTQETQQSIRASVACNSAWDEFLQLAQHHRVQPLVYRNLVQADAVLPPQVQSALKDAATRNAHAAMRCMREVKRLTSLLENAGMSVRLLKGVPLSLLAYGDASLRDVGDIDLLIAPGEEERADAILAADRWRRIDPAGRLTPRRRRALRRHTKDYTYDPGAAQGFELDLHWRLFRNPQMPGNALGAVDARATVTLGETQFATLPSSHMLLHLCVHGALEGWIRFKSLADVAALWMRFDVQEREQVLALARRHDVVQELSAALLLSALLGVLDRAVIPAPLLLHGEDQGVVRITDHALSNLFRFRFRPTTTDEGSWAAKRYEFGLRTGFGYRAEIVRRVLFRPRIWRTFDLPDTLFPMYALLSPVEWAWFHVRRARLAAPADKAAARQSKWRRLWARLRSVPWAERGLLAEAAATLLAARVALRVLPTKVIVRWVQRPQAGGSIAASEGAVAKVRWAVIAVARHAPLHFVCFPQALAAYAMLRRRRVNSEVVYGVRRSADGRLRAHTWLKVEERTILGGETATHFAPIEAWRSPAVR